MRWIDVLFIASFLACVMTMAGMKRKETDPKVKLWQAISATSFTATGFARAFLDKSVVEIILLIIFVPLTLLFWWDWWKNR